MRSIIVGSRRQRGRAPLVQRLVASAIVSGGLREPGPDERPPDGRRIVIVEGLEMPFDFRHVGRPRLEILDGQHVMSVGVLGIDLEHFAAPSSTDSAALSWAMASSRSCSFGPLAFLSNFTALTR